MGTGDEGNDALIYGIPLQEGGGAWAPSDLSNLVLSLDSGTVVTDVDGVTQMTALHGTSNDATQSTGSLKPDLTADGWSLGVDVVDPDGVDDFMALDSAMSLPGAFTFGALCKSATAVGRILVGSGTGNDWMVPAHTGNKVSVRIAGSSALELTPPNRTFINTVYRIIIIRDSSDDFAVYVDGVDNTSSGPPSRAGTWAWSRLFKNSTAERETELARLVVWATDHTASLSDIDTYLTP